MDLKNLSLLLFVVFMLSHHVLGNVVFPVQHRFRGRADRSLWNLKAHDNRRHARILASVDMELGGNGHPADTGLYYTKIGLGTPSKDYHVQLDTGSDTLWVNCAGCEKCPKKSEIGIELAVYDPKASSTGNLVYCDDKFCTSTYDGLLAGCRPNILCQYNVVYGDGSSTAGFYVRDSITLDGVIGDLRTGPMNGTIVFGCGAKQSGELGTSSEALDGIIGFGQANSSMLSQLAAAGKVKKVFSHCLDGANGGGIFAVGEVVQPKVKTTPIIPNQAHYNVILKEVEVGGDVLATSTDLFDSGDQKEVIIDSGTTLAYLPDELYNSLMTKIMSQQPGLKIHTVEEQFSCIYFTGDVDDGFPTVTFHFKNNLSLTVHPHEYLFAVHETEWCFGWQNSELQSKDGKDMTLLGDLVLSNKLVVYDLENQVIGWTDYNCTSKIKVKDEKTGAAYYVGAHDISSASSLIIRKFLTSLVILVAVLHSLAH